MIRIGKLTDYAIVLLTHFARQPQGALLNARDLAAEAHIPFPTANKVLRSLCRAGLLMSHRGVKGGFFLARRAEEVSVAAIISAIDGPLTLTECSSTAPGLCDLEPVCPTRTNWMKINQTVAKALDGLTLRDMAGPAQGAMGHTLSIVARSQRA